MGPDAMLCSPVATCPDGDRWVLQPKWDGWRMLVSQRAGRAAAFTRHGTAITDRLDADVVEGLDELVAGGAVLDGELVWLAPGGAGPTADFAALGARMAGGRPAEGRLVFVAFDLLELAGEDLRQSPWQARDRQLRDLVIERPGVSTIDTLPAAAATHEHLVSAGFEGSVLKRVDAGYRAGRSRSWLKLKARHELTGWVLGVGDSRDRGRVALCELDGGGRCWAPASGARVGDQVTVVYARRDRDGSLRDARARPVQPDARAG